MKWRHLELLKVTSRRKSILERTLISLRSLLHPNDYDHALWWIYDCVDNFFQWRNMTPLLCFCEFKYRHYLQNSAYDADWTFTHHTMTTVTLYMASQKYYRLNCWGFDKIDVRMTHVMRWEQAEHGKMQSVPEIVCYDIYVMLLWVETHTSWLQLIASNVKTQITDNLFLSRTWTERFIPLPWKNIWLKCMTCVKYVIMYHLKSYWFQKP